jgi:hypothetical protein
MQHFLRASIAALLIAAMFVVPVVSAPLAQDDQAVIVSPADGQAVSGLVPVFGTATARDFARYEIAYGPDPNPGDQWSTFAVADIVLINAQIGLWDANLTPGVYALRLRVFRSDGSVAAEDFANGLIVGTPPTETPAATPTDVPPPPTFEPETAETIAPTIVIEQPPSPTPEPTAIGDSASGDSASPSRRGGATIDLGRFTSAFADGVTCAFGAFFLFGAVVLTRWGVRWFMKQMRERSGQ